MIHRPFWENMTSAELSFVVDAYHALILTFTTPVSYVRVDMWNRLKPFSDFNLNVRESAAMARKRKGLVEVNGNVPSKSGTGKIAWINIKLTEEMENDAAIFSAEPSLCAADFLSLVGEGYDVTLKLSEKDTFMACAYGTQEDGIRYGVSAWASTPLDACAALIVKVRRLLENPDDLTAEPPEKKRFR